MTPPNWDEILDLSSPHTLPPSRNYFLDYFQDKSNRERLYSNCVDQDTFKAYTSEPNLVWRIKGFLSRYGYLSEEEFSAAIKQDGVIADLGAGGGMYLLWLTRLFPDAAILGVDFSESLSLLDQHCGPFPNLGLLRCDLNRTIPIQDQTVDFAICDYVLSEVKDPRFTIGQFARILKPEGRLAASFSLKRALPRKITDDFLQGFFNKGQDKDINAVAEELTGLARELAESGLKVKIKNNYKFLNLPPGEYPLQRFIYYFFLNCFWNGDETYSRKRNRSNFIISRDSKFYAADEITEMIDEVFNVERADNNLTSLSLLLKKK
ncbi:hypothetical protein AAU61_05500 [Desulfocarbo indianensis]|nr:hypothetical protein AAU61_05500 [Desulfocarbo indianensis]